MPRTALDLLLAKAKLAGAVVLGGVVATAAMSGGALSLVADSSGAPTQVVASSSAEPTESPEAKASEAPEAPDATETPEATDSPEAADATASAAPTQDVEVVLNHATVVSIDATTLIVTAEGASTTWTLSPDTHWTGAIKDPTQIKPGMVIHLRGTKTGDALTATHVVTPGKNKAKHEKRIKAVKAAKTHAKKSHGKRG